MKEKEIENAINSIVGDSLKEKDVTVVGNLVFVSLTYIDFLPEHNVRNMIEDVIPLCKVESIERIYSDNAIMHELMDMYKEGVIVPDIPLYASVEERLFSKAI